jgi:succinate dehydrogenase / fumarate reductase cytochrome b subunit
VALSPAAYANAKRLHSLSGVVPVGLFLFEHFFTNSYAMYGATSYNDHVKFLTGLPYLIAIEVFGIFLPIAFHAALGVFIWWTSKSNVSRYGYYRNWMYFLQRISGVYLLAFISVHVYKARFSGASPDTMFEHMAGYLNPAVDPSNWLWVAFYALGIVTASFHLGNGLFTFGISWGFLPGSRSQRWASRACMAVFVVMSLVGLNTLWSFSGGGVRFLNHPHDSTAPMRSLDDSGGPRAGIPR